MKDMNWSVQLQRLGIAYRFCTSHLQPLLYPYDGQSYLKKVAKIGVGVDIWPLQATLLTHN